MTWTSFLIVFILLVGGILLSGLYLLYLTACVLREAIGKGRLSESQMRPYPKGEGLPQVKMEPGSTWNEEGEPRT